METRKSYIFTYNTSNQFNHLAFLSFSSSFLLFFSPLSSLIFSLLLIRLADSINKSDPFKLYLSINIVLALSIIISSKEIPSIVNQSDDFARYYYFYLSIINSESTILDFQEFGSFEPGLLIYFKILSFFPEMNYQTYSMITSLLFYFIFLNWLYRYGISKNNIRFTGFIIALSLILIPSTLILQLTRQAFSLLFLLYAISSKKNFITIINLIFAVSFHLTALPIFIIIFFLQKFKFFGFFLAVITISIINIYLFTLVNDFPDVPKIANLQNLDEFNDMSINSGGLSWIILLYIYGICGLTSISKVKVFAFSLKNIGGIYPIIFFTIFYLIFFEVPLISTRTTLLYFSLLLGYLFSLITLSSDFKNFDYVVLLTAIIFISEKFLLNNFWQSFEIISWFPGYFLIL